MEVQKAAEEAKKRKTIQDGMERRDGEMGRDTLEEVACEHILERQQGYEQIEMVEGQFVLREQLKSKAAGGN